MHDRSKVRRKKIRTEGGKEGVRKKEGRKEERKKEIMND